MKEPSPLREDEVETIDEVLKETAAQPEASVPQGAHLDEEALALVARGEPPPGAHRHLATCHDCREKLPQPKVTLARRVSEWLEPLDPLLEIKWLPPVVAVTAAALFVLIPWLRSEKSTSDDAVVQAYLSGVVSVESTGVRSSAPSGQQVEIIPGAEVRLAWEPSVPPASDAAPDVFLVVKPLEPALPVQVLKAEARRDGILLRVAVPADQPWPASGRLQVAIAIGGQQETQADAMQAASVAFGNSTATDTEQAPATLTCETLKVSGWKLCTLPYRFQVQAP